MEYQNLIDSDEWNFFLLENAYYTDGPNLRLLMVFYHVPTDTIIMEPLLDVGRTQGLNTT